MTLPLETLTRKEVAALLKVCPKTVDRLRKRGELMATRVGVRGVRYQVSQVQRYLDRHTRPVKR